MKRVLSLCAATACALACARAAVAAPPQPAELLADFAPTASQVAKESRGAVTVRLSGLGGALRTVQAQTVVEAPASTVWSVLTDYPDYPKLFPRIARSELRIVGGQQEHYTLLRYPWPFSQRWVLDAIYPDRRHWTVTWHRLDGTVRHLEGEWQLVPMGNQTVLRYGVRIDPGLPFVPMWAIQWGTQVMTPSILRAVAAEAQRRAEIQTAHRMLTPLIAPRPAGSPGQPSVANAGYRPARR